MAALRTLFRRRTLGGAPLRGRRLRGLWVGGWLFLLSGLSQVGGPDLARGQEAPLPIKLPAVVVVVEETETLVGERSPVLPPEVLTEVDLGDLSPGPAPRPRASRVISLGEKTAPNVPKPPDCYGSPFLSGWAKSSEGASAYYHRGIFLFLEGKGNEALEEFKGGLKLTPTADLAGRLRYWQGEAHFRQGDEEAAVGAWREAARDSISPFSGDALYSLGWVTFRRGDYAEALRHLERLASRYPHHPRRAQALFLAGESALEAGRPERAAMHLQEVVDSAPQSREAGHASFRLAETLLGLERYPEAARAFLAYLARSDVEPAYGGPSRRGMAWSLFLAGQHEASAKAFSEYIAGASGADLLEARFGRLASLLRTGKRKEAEAELRSLHEADPKSPWSLQAGLSLGVHLFRVKDYRQAADTLREALSQTPEGMGEAKTRDLARLLLGASLYNAGEYGASTEVLLAATQKEGAPGGEEAALGLIWARLRSGDAEGAAKAAEEFKARLPSSGQLQEAAFWKGEALLRLKRYEAARSAFAEVSAAHPRYAEATLGLGWAYFGEGRWLDAREAFRRAASLSAQSPALLGQSLFQEGESSFNLKDYDSAIGAYEALLRDLPAHPLAEEAAFRLGTFHYKKGDFERAAATFTSYLSRPRTPAQDRGQYWLGLSRLRARQYRLARVAFQRLARDFPESPLREDGLLRVGHAYYNEGRFAEAAEAYQALLGEKPREERAREARYGIALTRLRGGDVAGFIRESRDFIQRSPEHPLALTLEFQLGEHFLSQQQYEEARASYARVLAHQAGQELADSAQFRMAEIESLLGRHRQAAKLFQELIARFPESRLRGDARLRLAQALSASGDCRQALEEYRLFFRGFPRHSLLVRALFEAGTCARRLGDDGAAREFFSALVGQEPSGVLTAQSHWELAEMAKARGELQTALEHTEKALAGGGRELRARAQFALGELLQSLKEPRRAIVEYLKVAYLYAEEKALTDLALLRAGGIYEELGERDQALKIYGKVKMESGDPAIIQRAQERIGALGEKPR